MATIIYSTSADGHLKYAFLTGGTWDTVHDAASAGIMVQSTTMEVLIYESILFGHNLSRSFLAFDVSSISIKPDSATLNIYGHSGTTVDIIVVKSYHGDTLTVADFNMLCDGGCSAGFDEDDLTAYSSQISSWSADAYNTITLNDTALTDIGDNATLYLAIIGHDNDYNDYPPAGSSTNVNMTFRTSAYSGTSSDPYLSIVEAGKGKIILSSGKVTLAGGKISF